MIRSLRATQSSIAIPVWSVSQTKYVDTLKPRNETDAGLEFVTETATGYAGVG